MSISSSTSDAVASSVSDKLISELTKVIRGRDEAVKLVITALLADGHVLLEDYPGSGKTTLAKTLGRLITSQKTSEDFRSFRRIQFTPDLLPGDVLGVNIFDPESAKFNFQSGPVFAHIVLADEINRTGPKVQSAFLECMAEKQVTIDNHTHQLDDLFFVIGTQNPLDLAGTYPLPLVQLDRFLFKIPMSYVDAETELNILAEHNEITNLTNNIASVVSREEILDVRKEVAEVKVSPLIAQAIVDLVQASRGNSDFQFGLSTRSALMMQRALQAWAIVNGRDYIIEDDFKFLAPYVFNHRLDSNASFTESNEILAKVLNPVVDRLVNSGINSI